LPVRAIYGRSTAKRRSNAILLVARNTRLTSRMFAAAPGMVKVGKPRDFISRAEDRRSRI
jgi:hypothetical protein